MADLTHDTELVALIVRIVTLSMVLWDSVDAVKDLRRWWGRDGRELMLAKWRVAHDLFLIVLVSTWLASMVYVIRAPHHGETTHALIAYQNAVVVFLLAKTMYMRVIRVRIAAAWQVGDD